MGIKISKSKFSWEEYWSNKRSGDHRFSTEKFLSKEGKEKLFHLDGGKSLLDFGCGSGDLLIYYVPNYERVVGVDFSVSMLEEARTKIMDKKYENVCLILADEKTAWNKLNSSFDRITSAGVIQYLTFEQIENLISKSSGYLNDEGKIIFFDVIDPRLYVLWKIGLFSKGNNYWKMLPRIFFEFFYYTSGVLNNKPRDITGYSHSPDKMEQIANKYDFEMEYVKSMYYEYRYHAILSKRS